MRQMAWAQLGFGNHLAPIVWFIDFPKWVKRKQKSE